MRLTFVETETYQEYSSDVIDDAAKRALEDTLLKNPEAGDLIAGTGGARKVRVKRAGGGKSGGFRVIYVYLSARSKVYLLLAYGKDVADDLSSEGVKLLADVVARIKEKK